KQQSTCLRYKHQLNIGNVNEKKKKLRVTRMSQTCVKSFAEVGQHIWERCDTAEALLRRGCPSDRLEDPRGSAVLLKNRKITFHPKEQRHRAHHRQVTQLQPQSVLLHLRPGEPQTFELKFKRVEDYPIDLYYLMDLSFSMEDDLPNVKKLGTDLMEEMRNITSDFRMGFGAFVDKTVMPYISTAEDLLHNPCKRAEPWPCAPPFTYHHVLSLTANGSLFTELVGGQRISGNLDSPEGGLDALMQATVCEIGWRNVTRLLVFSTDAGLHFAGDGKLGGIVLPNDGKCHLHDNVYSRGNSQDYPSVAHIAEKLREKNVQIIFAVTEDVTHLHVLPKCAVGTLSNNSHNILQIIVEAYNVSEPQTGSLLTIPQLMRLTVLLTPGVSFNVSITAPPCATSSHRPSRVIIKPQGYSEEVEVLLSPICGCSCQKDKVPHSPSCSHGNGTLECGACRCKEGRVGTFCECNQVESGEAVDSYLCHRDNASEQCSGHGQCVCGKCVCDKSSKKPNQAYYGQYCECSDFNCDQYQGLQCGGGGKCVCGVCECLPGFSGRACECPLSVESCLSHDGQVCAGRGVCHCGTCICQDPRYQGPTCDLCPSCPSCILCRAFSQSLNPKECETRCAHLNLTVVGQAALLALVPPSAGLHRCMELDTEGCRVHFLLRAGQKEECPSGPNVVLITAVASASVVVLGVAFLLLWKLLTSIHDRREFARFQRELEKRDNPIYRSAITTTVNPKYKEQ
uniref:Integrin beta n=1 Tax=Myripristis murdjan TaxID=586833 RepID=A0A667WYV0_9TELE